MNLAVAVVVVFVGIVSIMFVYTFVYYPIMTELNTTFTQFGMHDESTVEFFKMNFYIASAVGLILSFGLFIWLIARIAKREEYEWR